jgi:hypothetical protein
MPVLSCAAVDSAYSVVLTAIVCLETLLWLEFCCCITIADYFPSATNASKILASLLLLYSAPAVVCVHAVASIPIVVNIPFPPVLSAICRCLLPLVFLLL